MFSIIIPVHNQMEMTQACIESIVVNTDDYEIIIVDNGSSLKVDIDFYYSELPVKMICNKENLGFPKAVNQGIEASNGDVVVILNNDVIVTSHWLENLQWHLSNGLDMVGPCTNSISGPQQVLIDKYDNEQELNTAAMAFQLKNAFQSMPFHRLVFYCVAIKREVIDTVGLLDEIYTPGNCEDDDYCMRAISAGFKLGIAKDVFVHHFGSVTHKALGIDYQELIARNQKILNERWGGGYQELINLNQARNIDDGPKLNLGCGFRKIENYINIDNRSEVEPDLVCDVMKGLPYEDSSIDEVRAFDFLEHIPIGTTVAVIEEIWRVLKPGGKFESFTPDAETGQGAFQDPTHVSFWVQNSWLYYSHPEYRKLHDITADFNIVKIDRIETDKHGRVYHLHVIAEARKEK